ncbi:MAG: hypothetical protein E7A72_08680 [Actinomyces urogenitalis]|jgi:hypothetical protein|uniref:Uncharacterized protein n=3 Tax=Actinomyces urogenitalis TaxID=103621 RepID=C0W7W0_9ACTO|nr:hypothetical protein [Actinomyces urogenitalis]ETJ04272.1 MAG: hypothetical protein Q605_AUC00719G0002 [Actinomyces urogenitalis DORA_12]EEH65186.1 hypothetical protein HMPREF0058_1954 [Actinomyces urogenitalis DSM 15434]KGF02488.1 hypothetical protein HMPREF1626_05440 [Actinomyces urogenitalis S6-C4]MBS5977969.1 hypothetical protein [Actinomyces urogenitalis]MBS6072891.1 hypothetical protein [Actinomyces urogenitalis]
MAQRTYLTTTYVRVSDQHQLHEMTDLLREMFVEAVRDVADVCVDDVRAASSLCSVVVTLRVEAEGAQAAADRADRIYDTAMNLMGQRADGLVQRQSSLTYA